MNFIVSLVGTQCFIYVVIGVAVGIFKYCFSLKKFSLRGVITFDFFI